MRIDIRELLIEKLNMNISNSFVVNAGIEQAKVSTSGPVRTTAAEIIDRASKIPTAAQLSGANTESSDSAKNTPEQTESFSEQIRVTVTTGQSNIRGNLSPNQAIELYEKIAKLL